MTSPSPPLSAEVEESRAAATRPHLDGQVLGQAIASDANTAMQVDSAGWTTLPDLLLAQCVYKYGTDDWQSISKVLRSHPLILAVTPNPEFIHVRSCQQRFHELLESYGLTFEPMEQHKGNAAQIPAPAQLARALFHERLQQVRAELKETVGQIRNLVEECMNVEESGRAVNAREDVVNEVMEEDVAPEDPTTSTTTAVATTLAAEEKEEAPAVIPGPADIPGEPLQTPPRLPRKQSKSPVRNPPAPSLSIQTINETTTTHPALDSPAVTTTTPMTATATPSDVRAWKKRILLVWDDILAHRHGPVFLHLVKPEQAPSYYAAIRHPLDLNTIRQRVQNGTITTTQEFHRDVLWMLQNSMMFNAEGTHLYRYAAEMKAFVDERLAALTNTEKLAARRNSVMTVASTTTASRRSSIVSTSEDFQQPQ